jgi:LuxR family maltose regulon positive regulatory protein
LGPLAYYLWGDKMVSGVIVQQSALKKLRAAKSLSQTVFVGAAFGYGKTTLIENYLKNRKFLYISCSEIAFKGTDNAFAQLLNAPEASIVVIDDLHALSSAELRDEVVKLCSRDDIWLILLSRSGVPEWLMGAYISLGFILITEKDLTFSAQDITNLLLMYGLDASDSDADLVLKITHGNAFAVRHVATKLLEGDPFGPNLQQDLNDSICTYIETSIITQWDADLVEFLMQMCMNEEFTLELAEMVSGNLYSARLLQKAKDTGNFLEFDGTVYRFRPLVQKALQNKTLKQWGSTRMKELAYNAGLFYEMNGELVRALKEYVKCGRLDRVKFLLVRNARTSLGSGQYYELRHYYFELEDYSVDSSPVLISAMSMLYSMLLQPDVSERYYDKLVDFSHRAVGGQKREALSRVAYLDLALPHRGCSDLFERVHTAVANTLNRGIELPEISVTGNLPSLLNGGKDLCGVLDSIEDMEDEKQSEILRALGRFKEGFFPCLLAEIYFEKSYSAQQVLPLLTRSQLQSEGCGVLEISFVSVGIQARINLQLGNIESAKLLIEAFKEKAIEGKAEHLVPNIDAFRCRLAVLEGDKDHVRQWLDQAPDENKEFNILERFRYLTKVRCYVSLFQNMEAMHLLEKIKYYAEAYGRDYLKIEIGVLSAIVKDRLHIDWKADLLCALKSACELGFFRVVSEEGEAVCALLKQLGAAEIEEAGIDLDWYMQLLKEADDMALYYPAYLKRHISDTLNFSANAIEVLRLQAEGLSINKIAEKMGLKPDTVKYHAKENYRKLGVSGKTDAVLMARSVGIL